MIAPREGAARRPFGERGDLAPTVLLLALPWALFARVLGLWWADDGLEMLRFLRGHPFADYVWFPEAWRSLPGSVLTPLQFLSLHLDLAAFGMAPRAFYAHQLLALGIAAVALYAALREATDRGPALAGAALFLLGPAVAALAAMIPARHYAEALACGAVATLLFTRAVRTGRRGLAWAAAASTFAGMCFKETMVPLPAWLLVLPVGGFRARRRAWLPQAAAAGVYVAYRAWMLGREMLQGYGLTILPEDLPKQVTHLPAAAMRLAIGAAPASWVLLAGIGAAALLLVVRDARTLPALVLGPLLALAPIVPVSLDLSERYVFTLWAGLSALVGCGLACVAGRRPRAIAAFVALGAALGVQRPLWAGVLAHAARSDAESRALLRLGDGDVLRRPDSMAAFRGELQRYRAEMLHLPGAPGWFEDDLALCGERLAARRLWQYDAAVGEVVDVTSRRAALRAAACDAIRWDAPLGVRLRLDAGQLTWRLEGAGSFALVLDEGLRAIPVPPRAGFHRPIPLPLALRVRRTDPSGYVTYSDPLRLRGEVGEEVRWARAERRSPLNAGRARRERSRAARRARREPPGRRGARSDRPPPRG